MRTYSPKAGDLTRSWHVLDAEGVVLGRLATEVARLLRGKHRPDFTPHLDSGDAVIVVNAARVRMTAGKATAKMAYRHSGYPGGLRATSYEHLLESRPEEVVVRAVRGMLPAHPARPRPDPQALRLRGARAPARGAAAFPLRHVGAPARLRSQMPKPLTQSTGRRKEAVARVRVRPGSGVITVNDRPFDQYFTSAAHRMVVLEPLRLSNLTDVYDVDASIDGGGVAGQAGAMRLGIARSLVELDGELRASLKKAGLLTRDAREKESKKYGLKKARKAPQYSKR